MYASHYHLHGADIEKHRETEKAEKRPANLLTIYFPIDF